MLLHFNLPLRENNTDYYGREKAMDVHKMVVHGTCWYLNYYCTQMIYGKDQDRDIIYK